MDGHPRGRHVPRHRARRAERGRLHRRPRCGDVRAAGRARLGVVRAAGRRGVRGRGGGARLAERAAERDRRRPRCAGAERRSGGRPDLELDERRRRGSLRRAGARGRRRRGGQPALAHRADAGPDDRRRTGRRHAVHRRGARAQRPLVQRLERAAPGRAELGGADPDRAARPAAGQPSGRGRGRVRRDHAAGGGARRARRAAAAAGAHARRAEPDRHDGSRPGTPDRAGPAGGERHRDRARRGIPGDRGRRVHRRRGTSAAARSEPDDARRLVVRASLRAADRHQLRLPAADEPALRPHVVRAPRERRPVRLRARAQLRRLAGDPVGARLRHPARRRADLQRDGRRPDRRSGRRPAVPPGRHGRARPAHDRPAGAPGARARRRPAGAGAHARRRRQRRHPEPDHRRNGHAERKRRSVQPAVADRRRAAADLDRGARGGRADRRRRRGRRGRRRRRARHVFPARAADDLGPARRRVRLQLRPRRRRSDGGFGDRQPARDDRLELRRRARGSRPAARARRHQRGVLPGPQPDRVRGAADRQADPGNGGLRRLAGRAGRRGLDAGARRRAADAADRRRRRPRRRVRLGGQRRVSGVFAARVQRFADQRRAVGRPVHRHPRHGRLHGRPDPAVDGRPGDHDSRLDRNHQPHPRCRRLVDAGDSPRRDHGRHRHRRTDLRDRDGAPARPRDPVRSAAARRRRRARADHRRAAGADLELRRAADRAGLAGRARRERLRGPLRRRAAGAAQPVVRGRAVRHVADPHRPGRQRRQRRALARERQRRLRRQRVRRRARSPSPARRSRSARARRRRAPTGP